MADELAEIMEKFVLSNKESNETLIIPDDLDQGIKNCSKCLIGKVIGEKRVNFNGMKNFVTSAWGASKKLSLAEIGPNFFQFYLDHESDLERIVNGGPWIFDNQVLVVKKWQEGIEEDEKAFLVTPIWIQVWNLPLHWITKEIGMKIGSVFEKVRDVIIPQSGSREGKYLKLLVDIDTSQPIVRGTTTNYNGSTRWIQFRYEKCPNFCYNCGLIGHGDKSCFKRSLDCGKNQGQQFGEWLKVKGFKNTPAAGKTPVNHEYFDRLKSIKKADNMPEKEMVTTVTREADPNSRYGRYEVTDQEERQVDSTSSRQQKEWRENSNSSVVINDATFLGGRFDPTLILVGPGVNYSGKLEVGLNHSNSTKNKDRELDPTSTKENTELSSLGPNHLNGLDSLNMTSPSCMEIEDRSTQPISSSEEKNLKQPKVRKFRRLTEASANPSKELIPNVLSSLNQGKRKWEVSSVKTNEDDVEEPAKKKGIWLLKENEEQVDLVQGAFQEKSPKTQ